MLETDGDCGMRDRGDPALLRCYSRAEDPSASLRQEVPSRGLQARGLADCAKVLLGVLILRSQSTIRGFDEMWLGRPARAFERGARARQILGRDF